MADNKNSKLELDSVLKEIKDNDDADSPKAKEVGSSDTIMHGSQTKTIVKTIRMPDDEIDVLNRHFYEMGYTTFSSGCRRILREYIKKNNLK